MDTRTESNPKAAILGRLAQRIAAVEEAGYTPVRRERRLIPTGWKALDHRLEGGLAAGTVHEWFSIAGGRGLPLRSASHYSAPDHGGNCTQQGATGSVAQRPTCANATSMSVWKDGSIGKIRTACPPGKAVAPSSPSCDFLHGSPNTSATFNRQSLAPPLSILIHLAWQALEQDCSRAVIWIGRWSRPSIHALIRRAGCAGEDRRLLDQSIFVNVNDDSREVEARVWAIDLAARSPAVACMVADGSGIDMPASRRLQLAAQEGDALILLARPHHDLKHLSAAATRWAVSPSPGAAWAPRLRESAHPHHNHQSSIIFNHQLDSPLTPRWTARLLRCKGLQPVVAAHELPCEFALEVCRETGSLRLSVDVADRSGEAADVALVRRSA